MTVNEFAKEVHENAVAHGWWETARSFPEVAALIHSEVSEALEEADITLDRGHLAGLWFLRARARRAENGAGRRVDMTFRARIDLG